MDGRRTTHSKGSLCEASFLTLVVLFANSYARDPYTEDQAARIVSAILSAVAYMHNKGV